MANTRAPVSKLAIAALEAVSLFVATRAIAAPSGMTRVASRNSTWLDGRANADALVAGLRDGEPATQAVNR